MSNSNPLKRLMEAAASAQPSVAKRPKSAHGNSAVSPWKNVLRQYIDRPEQFGAEVVLENTADYVLIRDAYPKASVHLLAIARTCAAPDVLALNRSHLALLEKLLDVAVRTKAAHPAKTLRVGFHAVPSMAHLHMHLIADDFVSDSLKTKQHWNTFTTAFFIPLEKAIADIAEFGWVQADKSELELLLKRPLACHKCGFKPSNMPLLKRHLLEHVRLAENTKND
ncbi:hypothetical protein HDU84_008121 [Entophlyctis sp. JEL0112]|nr:hypothetical protein HDU84_008121 [Entophlyctis sp. JEL0112]